MSLADQISADFLAALKAKDSRRLAILRLAKAAIKNQEIDQGAPLNDAAIVQVLKKMVKQLEEAIRDFVKGGRSDLVEQNSEELNILQAYLPAELSEEEARKLVTAAVTEAEGAGLTGFGPIMGAVMKKVGGKLEGARVKELVSKILQI